MRTVLLTLPARGLAGSSRWARARLAVLVGGRGRLRVIGLLAGVLALDSADKAAIGAVALELEQDLGISNFEIGLLASAASLVAVIAVLPAGLLVDQVRRTWLLAAGIVLWSLAMLASAAAVSYQMLLVSQLAMGAMVAMAGPAVASLTGDFFAAAERGRIYGFVLAGELVGTGVGLVLAGALAGSVSWRAAFVVLALPGLALAVAVWRALPEPERGGQSRLQDEWHPRDAEQEVVAEEAAQEGVAPHPELILYQDPVRMSLPDAVRYVLRIRTNVYLIVASALGYFFLSGLRTFAVSFVHEHFGLGSGSASGLLFVIGLGAVAGVLISGRLADWLVRRGHLQARVVVGGICFVIAAVFFLPGLLVTALVMSVMFFVLAAAGLGAANPPLDAARLDIMHPRLWGRAESVRSLLRTGLEAVGPVTFGALADLFGALAPGAPELEWMFVVMTLPLVAAGVILLGWARMTYARDVATAAASAKQTAQAG